MFSEMAVSVAKHGDRHMSVEQGCYGGWQQAAEVMKKSGFKHVDRAGSQDASTGTKVRYPVNT